MELFHHGIKGQKWGVRRFQNKDGTRILAGKLKRNSQIRLSPNQTVYRSTRSDSTNFMNREYTYVNATEDLANHYRAVSEGFDGAFSKVFKFHPTHELKIANFNDFADELIKQCSGDTSIKLSDISNETLNDGLEILDKISSTNPSYIDGMFGVSKAFDKVIKGLKDKGFDGCMDPVDARDQVKNLGDDYEEVMAMVIFDPSKNLKIEYVTDM